MKKLPFLMLIVVVLISMTSCTSKNTAVNNGNRYFLEPIPFKYEKDGKWGFIDFNGKIVIEPRYKNKPTYFQDGYAQISDDTVHYYINISGDTIGSHYFRGYLFNDGLALTVDKDGKIFFIDEKGNIKFRADTLLNDEFYSCGSFSCNRAIVRIRSQLYGYMNKSGEVVIEPKYTSVRNFSENLAYVELKNEETDRMEKMIIDTAGNTVKKLNESLEWIEPFREGKAAYKDSSGCGYLDTEGEIIIQPKKKWQDLTNFVNGYAAYKSGGDWGVIDSTGSKILSSVYERPPLFYNGRAIISENDRYSLINLEGKKVFDHYYDHIAYPLFDSIYFAKDGKYYIMIDQNGEQLKTEEVYRIDLTSLFDYSSHTGYILIGEKYGISLHRLNDDSDEMKEYYSKLRGAFEMLYEN